MGNLIFTDRHLREYERENIGMVFMPIVFGAFKSWTQDQVEEIGMIFEYVE